MLERSSAVEVMNAGNMLNLDLLAWNKGNEHQDRRERRDSWALLIEIGNIVTMPHAHVPTREVDWHVGLADKAQSKISRCGLHLDVPRLQTMVRSWRFQARSKTIMTLVLWITWPHSPLLHESGLWWTDQKLKNLVLIFLFWKYPSYLGRNEVSSYV